MTTLPARERKRVRVGRVGCSLQALTTVGERGPGGLR